MKFAINLILFVTKIWGDLWVISAEFVLRTEHYHLDQIGCGCFKEGDEWYYGTKKVVKIICFVHRISKSIRIRFVRKSKLLHTGHAVMHIAEIAESRCSRSNFL